LPALLRQYGEESVSFNKPADNEKGIGTATDAFFIVGRGFLV
jgi:hypothetical protein